MATTKTKGAKASKAVSQERGAARIQELTEQFPEMPRSMVIHADYIIKGIKNTSVMKEIARWAIPDSHDLYEYDHEEHSPEEMVGAYTTTPHSFYLRNGTCFKLMFDSTSPYEIKYEGRGSYWLYRDDEPLEEVHFPPCYQWFKKTTSSGKPMASVLGIRGERSLSLITHNHCEYFIGDNECKYCNMTSGAKRLVELGLEKTLGKREQDIYETYLAAVAEMGHIDGLTFGGGSFLNRKKEADNWIHFAGILKRAMKDSGVAFPLSVGLQAMEKEDYQRCKEAGGVSTVASLEVWDPKLFEWLCPGKSKNVGREHWIECLLGAVEVFGKGGVSCQFVLGTELVPPLGFKTEDEAAESVLEGFRFTASHGISPGLHIMRTVPGAKLFHAPRPRIEYILRMERAHHQIQKEYGLSRRGGGRGTQPNSNAGFSIPGDWLDVPEEDIWPPALR